MLLGNQKAIRILSNVNYFQLYGEESGPLPSAEPLFKKLEILKFEQIFQLNIVNFVFSTLCYESPSIFWVGLRFVTLYTPMPLRRLLLLYAKITLI